MILKKYKYRTYIANVSKIKKKCPPKFTSPRRRRRKRIQLNSKALKFKYKVR